ncbi:MAG: protein translocase subunit SecF [Gammaproteobacteria bacterium]|nr:MAG: protein translocase subunit SecF [Gammaproteobacteria bacterium]
MELFKKTTHIDFLGKRKIAYVFSLVLILISLGSLATRGLNLGIDFTGGTLVELGYAEDVELAGVRQALADNGYDGAVVLHFGTSRDVLIRIAPRADASSADLSTEVFRILQKVAGGEVEIRRVEFVGPQVGDELTEAGGLALLYALLGILIYVGFRFQLRMAAGAIAALVHDVLITVGVFSVAQVGFDLSVLAAVLAVIGYSLNDTIVVFDRIRENFRKVRKGGTLEVMNTSLNQTLARTLMTSATTLLVLTALFLVGGEVIHSFAFALIIGVLIGTYSSIYVASPVAHILGISRADFVMVKKEGAELSDLP